MTTANNNSGNWITVPITTNANPTINIPNNGVYSGGNIIFTIGTGGGGGGTCADPEIELALPVEKKKKESAGCKCKKCKEFYDYAEPNQEDGTLVCWSCRHGY